ncbi:MAG: PKD domain-containing protein, partial [Gammaproteobacteria bacterium]
LENQTQTVSLDLYFSDEEDADSKNLGYSVTVDGSQPSSSDDATSWVSLSGYTLDLQPTKDSQAGSYALVVTATDASGQSVTDSFQVAVIMLNDAPMASVIPDQTVLEDGELTLDVSSYFSDEEGDAISLSASLSTGSSLPAWISWDGSTFIFTPENTQIGSHLIKVTAQSGTASVETQFEVTVTAVDDAPIWGDLASLTIGEGSYTAGHVVGTVVATDEDSASLTFALTGDSRLEVGSITTEGDGPYVHQAQIVVAGASAAFSSVSDAVIDLTIAAADSTSSVDSDLQLTVLQGEPPVADAGADQIVEIGQTVQLDGSASYDPQNVALAYSWVMVEGSDSVVLSSATSAQSSFTAPNEAVLLVFELTVMRAGAVNAVTHTDRIKIMVRDPMDAELNNNVSAQQAALVVADLGTSIGHRLGNSAPASIGPISQEDTDSFARFLVQNANAVNSGDLKTLMRSMSFDQSVGGVNRDDPESEGWGSIWIRVGAHDISDLGSESLAWDGSITNFQTGLDIFMGNGLMLGLIYSNSDGEFDFGEDGSARVGTYNTSMSSLHPWIGYSNSSIKVWLSVGQGDGTLEIANGLGVDAGESYSSDSSLSATQLGFSWAATGWLDLKFEQNTTDFEVQESELIELSEISTDQTRASLAFSHSFSIGDAGAALTPSLEVGIRDESTTGLTVAKSGTEMGLKFNYYSGNGLVVEGGTRTLEVDEGSYKEEGFYVLFKLDLGIQDRGWAFSIRPTYGDMQSRVRQVWDGELVDEADPQHQGYSLATQVSHPVALGTGWLLKPYAQIRSAGSVPEDVQLGAHVQLSNFLDMGIYQQRQYRGLDVEESIQLEAKLMF